MCGRGLNGRGHACEQLRVGVRGAADRQVCKGSYHACAALAVPLLPLHSQCHYTGIRWPLCGQEAHMHAAFLEHCSS